MDEITMSQTLDQENNIIVPCFSKIIDCISKRPLFITIVIGTIAIFFLIISIVPANVCNSDLCHILTWMCLTSAIICIFIAIMIGIYIGVCTKKDKTMGPDYMMTPVTDMRFDITGSEEDLPEVKNKLT